MIAVGLMSGTSLDGIDAALLQIVPRGIGYEVRLLDFATVEFEEALRDRLLALLPPNAGSVAEVAALHRELGTCFARAARTVAGDMMVDYAASHGQTVWHDGERSVTLQIGDPFAVRDEMLATVCFDFRSADCAAGGSGAPLVPYVDALLLGSDDETRVAVNIGGIANITVIPRASRDVRAFDSGPGNMLIDAFVRERSGGRRRFDEDGVLALRGRVDEAALRALLEDPYYAQEPPKSTGRERFGAQYLRANDRLLRDLSLEDGAATLTALTARSLADAIRAHAPGGSRVLVSGGGAHNAAVMRGLAERLEGFRVERSETMNVQGDAKEALAFAVLGYETLRGRAANVPQATGAARHTVLGAIAPYELRRLFEVMEAECAV